MRTWSCRIQTFATIKSGIFLDMRHFRIVLALLLMLGPSSARAQRVTEVFVPNHRIAEELMPVAQAALGSEGSATLDARSNSVILIGPRGIVDEALALLKRQDRRTPVVLIHYQSIALSELARAGLEIDWEIEVGMGVGRVSVSSANASMGSSSAEARGRFYRTGESEAFSGRLRILSGQVGHVGRGRTVPLEGRDLLGRVVLGSATAERGFSASPRVLGNGRIQLEFTNTEATVDDAGRVEFSNATTTLIVDPGETVAIGSLAQSSRVEKKGGKFYSTRISTRSSEDKRIFLLTLEVE